MPNCHRTDMSLWRTKGRPENLLQILEIDIAVLGFNGVVNSDRVVNQGASMKGHVEAPNELR